jgi:hypothetical protein
MVFVKPAREQSHTEVSELSAHNRLCGAQRASANAYMLRLRTFTLPSAGIAGHQIAARSYIVVQTKAPSASAWISIGNSRAVHQMHCKIVLPTRSGSVATII